MISCEAKAEFGPKFCNFNKKIGDSKFLKINVDNLITTNQPFMCFCGLFRKPEF